MTLLVDVGNTRLKWRWLEGPNGVPLDGVLPLKELDTATLAEQFAVGWAGRPQPCDALLSCVADENIASAVADAARLLGCQPYRMQSAAEACGVRNGYVQPELLGVDRWLGLVAARSLHQGSACIVGVGTALTVDLLDAEGQHHGGLLVPGPELMHQALVTRTARIGAAASQAEPQVREGLGVNTAGAMQEGGLLAAAALAVRAATDFAERTNAPVWLCLTGGGAETVAERLPTNAPWPEGIAGVEVQPDLVLQGLAVMAAASRDGLRHY
jgi:type III pantothenate kinase